MTGHAKTKEIVSKAEGAVANNVEKLRAHEVAMQRLSVLDALATNDKTVVMGNASNSLLAEMLVANKQSNVMLNLNDKGLLAQGADRSAVAA